MLLQNDGRLAVRCSGAWRSLVAAAVLGAAVAGAGMVGVRPVSAQDQPAPPAAPTEPTNPATPVDPAATAELAAPLEQTAPNAPADASAFAGAPAEAAADDQADDHAISSNPPVGADGKPAAQSAAKQQSVLRSEIRALEKQRDDVARQLSALEAELNASKRSGTTESRLKELYDGRSQALSQYSDLEARLAERRNRELGYARGRTPRPGATAAPKTYSDAFSPPSGGTSSRGGSRPPTPGESNPYAAGAAPTKPAPGGASDFAAQSTPQLGGQTNPNQNFSNRRSGAAAPPTEDAAAARVGGGAGAGVQLDLVNLANSVADASGAVRIAKAQLQAAVARAEGPGNRMEVATAEATLESATRRQDLLRGIARLALDGAARDLERHARLAQNNLVSAEELGEREAKVEMLKLIVSSAEDGRGGGARR